MGQSVVGCRGLALREIDIRLKVAARLASCIADTRQP